MTQLPVKAYLCPSDPSVDPSTGALLNGNGVLGGNPSANQAGSSYAVNAQVFTVVNSATFTIANYEAYPRIPSSIPDGSSNTIFMTEKYADCSFCGPVYNPDASIPCSDPSALNRGNAGNVWGRASGNGSLTAPGTTPPSTYGPYFANQLVGPTYQFQVQPIWGKSSPGMCDYRLPSSPHSGGIDVLLGDASVRFVSKGIAAATWWAALTPAGGEALGSDW